MDELERVAASYLLRPRGSTCFSSGNAVDEDIDDDDDDDDRFADDGSVYIYREGDSSPSAEDPPQGRENQQEEDAERGGGDDSGRNGRNFFAPQGVDGDDRAGHENNSGLWQDERRPKPSSARAPEAGWGVSGSGGHRGVSGQRTENGPTSMQHGGVAAGVNSKDSRQGNTDLYAWQHQEQQRLVGPSGGADLANRIHMRSVGGAQQTQPGDGKACEPPAATLEGRQKKSDLNFLPGRGIGGETPPAEEPFAVPVLGASYSAKIDRGLQGRGGRDTTTARGLPGEGCDGGASAEPSAKVRQTAARLRSMILERQASANRSIREVFGHFDRRRCGYVNVAEMRDALADLRLHLSPEEGKVSELQTTAMNSGPTEGVRLTVSCDARHSLWHTTHDMQIAAFSTRYMYDVLLLLEVRKEYAQTVHLPLVSKSLSRDC